jgi:hypothetical protein
MPHLASSLCQIHRLVHVLLVEYQKSVVNLVTKYVIADIHATIGQRGQTTEGILRCRGQKHDVEAWAMHKHPLAYLGGGYERLVKALYADLMKVGEGLPWAKPKQISIEEFALLLAKMEKPWNPAQFGPPVMKDKVFPYILCCCIAIFWSAKGDADDQVKTDLFINHVHHSADVLKINYVPWCAGFFPASGKTSGQASIDRNVVASSWVTLSGPTPHMRLPKHVFSSSEATGIALSTQKRLDMEADPRAGWRVSEIVLRDLGFYMNHRILPEEWDLKHASLPDHRNDLVTHTYNWVNDCIDLGDEVIWVVLYTAIIFSKAVPIIAHSQINTDSAPKFNNAQTNSLEPAEQDSLLTQWVCNQPWSNASTGARDQEPFVIMFTILFLAFYFKDSPLVIHYERYKSLGDKWAQKHREFLELYFSHTVHHQTPPGKKFLTPANFVRCRLAVALAPSASIFSRPKFNKNWACMNTATLKLRHIILLAFFKGDMGVHGVYSVLHELAVTICCSQGVLHPANFDD